LRSSTMIQRLPPVVAIVNGLARFSGSEKDADFGGWRSIGN
jgi:hypothetical protein